MYQCHINYIIIISHECHCPMWSVIHENPVGLSSLTNPKPKGQLLLYPIARSCYIYITVELMISVAYKSHTGQGYYLPQMVPFLIAGHIINYLQRDTEIRTMYMYSPHEARWTLVTACQQGHALLPTPLICTWIGTNAHNYISIPLSNARTTNTYIAIHVYYV
jgi:hypothetical protein